MDRALLTAKARKAGVPPHLVDGFVRYVVDGIRPGSFLQAIITNNLRQAVATADPESLASLPQIVTFMLWDVPDDCWGSQSLMADWISRHGRARLEARNGSDRTTPGASERPD